MKLLFISDIHGITTNLKYLEALIAKENFDKVIVRGDFYYPGFNSVSYQDVDNHLVLDFLMKYQDRLICIKGNCDSEIDLEKTGVPFSQLSYLSVEGLDFYLTHGHYYSYEKKEKFLDRKGVLIYGHFHVPYIKQEGNMTYVCVGSISLPRCGSKASYGVYFDHTISLYDVKGNLLKEVSV